MKTREIHQYHGIALAQIVEHSSFKALNKASKNYGHYVVNKNVRVFVKYRKVRSGSTSWQFPFTDKEIRRIDVDAKRRGDKTYVVLVCGKQTVCCLQYDVFNAILDRSVENKSLSVKTPAGASMRVESGGYELKGKIPHNAFPNILF